MPRPPRRSMPKCWRSDATNIAALAGLAKCYVATGAIEQAKQTLAMVPESKRNDAAVKAVQASIDLAEQAKSLGPVTELEQKVAANPLDHQARFDLATALNAAGQARRGDRAVARNRQARPQMERGRRAQAAGAVLRGLGRRPTRRPSRDESGCRRSCFREAAYSETSMPSTQGWGANRFSAKMNARTK